MLKKRGAKKITLVCLVGVQEGIDTINKDHPDVDIYLAAKDEVLNEKCLQPVSCRHFFIIVGDNSGKLCRSDGDETDRERVSANDREGVTALAEGEKRCVGVYGGRRFVCRRRGGVSGADDGGDGAADGAHTHLLLADPAGGYFNGGAGV